MEFSWLAKGVHDEVALDGKSQVRIAVDVFNVG
jgi:hypothetical protein